MKISLNWLKDFVQLPQKLDPQEFAHTFTLRTAEVEHVENQAKSMENIVVGKIIKIKPHPDADKLQITETQIGPDANDPNDIKQIVCGGPNIKEGMFVAVALPGSFVRWHGEGDLVKLSKAKIRGVESYGMICAGEEIGLAPTPDGIVDLADIANKENLKTGTPLSEALNKNDIILTIDNKSLTHRPDLWGHYGIARETAAIYGLSLKKPDTKSSYPSKATKTLDIEITAPKLCPRYLGVLIENIKIEPSPLWMQQRLINTGYRPINNIVDATNYVMAEFGQPMHAFDADIIKGGIIVRTATKNEKFKTLDGSEHKLTEDMLVIADHVKPVALAGIMGGANSEISDSTTRIIIESANFNPASVRKTSTKLGLRTESVQRFEKSLDPELAETAIDRICELIMEMCPQAQIATPKIDKGTYKPQNNKVSIDLKKVFSKIGKEIPMEEVQSILEKLEFKIDKTSNAKSETTTTVQVPSHRATKDVSIEDDLVEEIARLHGYENIEPILPKLPTILPEENTERKLKHRAREILSLGLGFTEVYNYSFYSQKDVHKCMLPEELHITVENYLSEDQTHMRVSLVPNILKNIALNLKNSNEFNIYEIGRTYEDLQEYFPIEEKKICGAIIRDKKYSSEVFYDAKGALESLLKFFNTKELTLRKGTALCPQAHPTKYASYVLNEGTEDETEIARVYELHPLIAKNYELEKAKIGIFEINFTKLSALNLKPAQYKPIPRFPDIHFDISVVIDRKKEMEEIRSAITKSNDGLITNVQLFDLYEGPNIPEGKKSAAFKITLQAEDRTLTDAEMKETQAEIFKNLQTIGGEIRGL